MAVPPVRLKFPNPMALERSAAVEGSNALASGSQGSPRSPPSGRLYPEWNSVEGTPGSSKRKRLAAIESDDDDDDELGDEDEEFFIETPTKSKNKGKAKALTSNKKVKKTAVSSQPETPTVKVPPVPDKTAPGEKHLEHLELWCQRWYNDGAASQYNREYLRPRAATVGEVKDENKDVSEFWWVWVCRHCKTWKRLKTAKTAGSGTGLNHHPGRCASNPANNRDGLHQTTLTLATELGPEVRALPTRHAIAVWVARNNHPFSIVEQDGFKDMFTRSFPALQKVLPSRRLVAQDIDTVFTVNAERLKRAFAAYVGVFHIAIDGWTDRRGNKFVGIYAHWTPMDDNGTSVSPSSCLIDFVPANASHTGAYLAKIVGKSLQDWEIEDRVLSIICDNASNNDVMLQNLAGKGFKRLTEGGRAIIEGATGTKWSSDDDEVVHKFLPGDDLDEFETEPEPEEEDFAVDQPILDEIRLPRVPFTQQTAVPLGTSTRSGAGAASQVTVEEKSAAATRESQGVMKGALVKVRTLAKRLRYRSSYRQIWGECVEALVQQKKIRAGAHTVPVDIVTRWNSTYECIKACNENEVVIKRFFLELDEKMYLAEDVMTDGDFAALRDLEPVLALLNAATKRFSTSTEMKIDNTSIAGVIPVMDAITSKFDVSRSTCRTSAVQYGIKRGQELLDKYYSKTDDSVLYRIALLLHPGYRVAYMQRMKWEQEWIDEAKRLGREMWEAFYRFDEEKREDVDAMEVADELDMLLAVDSQTVNDQADAFDAYINAPKIDIAGAPFHGQAFLWWAHQPTMCGMKQMAMDVLGTPATSVEVERAFSKAGLMMSVRRTRLDPNTSRAQMLVGDWKKRGLLSERGFVNAVQKANAKARERAVGQTFPKPKPTGTAEVIEIDDDVQATQPQSSTRGPNDMDIDIS